MLTSTNSVADLSREKQALLLKRLSERNSTTNRSISKRQHITPCHLSFAQERLWFVTRLQPDDPFYNMAGVIQIRGPLNVALLEQALNEVIQRHEILRTSFAQIDDEVRQIIHSHGEIDLRQTDLSDLLAEQQHQMLEAIQKDEARQAFDLERLPLIRTMLIKLGYEHFQLSLTLHHIIADEWSLRLLIKEVGQFYRQMQRGQPVNEPELAIQYADFAEWQRKYLQGKHYEQQLSYWQNYLASAPGSLGLPTDYSRPSQMTYRGGDFHFVLPNEFSQTLINLSRQTDTTLFAVMMAAFNVLLWRYSGQSDICIGYPVANRNRQELEGLIGFFVNLQVLRSDLSDNPSFLALLQRVKHRLLEAQKHQDLPFERLVEAIQPQRELNRSPLFQVMLVYQHAALETLNIPGLHFELAEVELDSAKYDLTFNVFRSGDQIRCNINYSRDLFAESTIERMAEHWQQLLASIATQPDKPISEFTILSQAEIQQALYDWNTTDVEYSQNACIHQLFEAQVEQMPDAIALTFEGQSLNYAELNAKANQLAHYLIERGVGPDALVGICIERSLEMVVGLLGILKAGGAYVPMEPNSPKERITYQMQDTGAKLLVTKARLVSMLPENEFVNVCIDSEWPEIEKCSAFNPIGPFFPSQLAYIIYTSGSTGLPKGVMIAHQAVLRLFAATEQQFRIGSQDIWTMFHSFAFDFSVWEIWGALLYGGRLVIVPHCITRSTDEFRYLLQQEQVTVLNQTPSAFLQLMHSNDQQSDRLESLRLVIFGGEALEPYKLKPWLDRYGARRPQMVNMYGITETTVHVTYRALTMNDAEASPVRPIGKPLADLQTYLLDASLNLCPVGCQGELYVGGAGLARGYLNRPELTAERFVPNPFGKPGSRLYKSGDLAKYGVDGELDYQGRIDHQVKIRGFRIELGEIEAQLLKHEDVKEVVVLAREDQPSDKRLVAYLIEKQLGTLQLDELKVQLKQTLPDYMIPSAFVILETMPLSTNGKLDWKKLPLPDLAGRLSKPYVTPRTETEVVLAEIWQELLGIEQVGIEDDFFELGGHSLLVTQLASRITKRFAIELPLRSVFEAGNIVMLAEKIEDVKCVHAGGMMDISKFILGEDIRDAPIPLSFAQQRLWFLDQLEPGSSSYNIPITLRLTGHLDLNALTESFNEIVRRHEILRTVFEMGDAGEPIQKILPSLVLNLEHIDLTAANQSTVWQTFCRDEAAKPFDLCQGPLIRASLLILADNSGNQDAILMLTMHHIVSDGWSLTILVKEFAALYSTFVQNQPSPLPELPIQYADFACWQRRWLVGDELERQLNYWPEQLGSASGFLELPTDHPRPSVMTYRGATQCFNIEPDLAQQIRVSSKQHNVTLFILLLTAFKLLLSRYSGQSDICVGTPVANRNRQEIENLIGFFVNTLVLRSDLSANPNFAELLGQVKSTVLDAQNHQDLPFEKLVEALQTERDPSRTPLFQVMFVLQNHDKLSLSLPGLEIAVVEDTSQTAKFDLTLHIQDWPDGRLSGAVEYNTDLFEAETIERFTRHYLILLQAAIKRPQVRVSELPLLSHTETRKILHDWNDTDVEYPQNRCVHQLFEAQVEQTPDAIALSFEGKHLSYAKLNTKANQLAHYLIERGVGPDVLVGICIERSLEMVIGLLGILKAGGAYVPLDPNYPEERLTFMLDDIKPIVVLTQAQFASRDLASSEVLSLDSDWGKVESYSVVNPCPDLQPTNLAYCIYTSGSTGQPKGAGVPHQGILNRLQWMQAKYKLDSTDHVLQKTPYSFDVSVWEFFWPLMTGARLIVAPPELHKDSQGLIELIRREHITTIHFVPSMLQAFVDTPGVEHCTSLKQVICSGEALSADLVQRFQQKLPAELHNLYGPTEASVDVSYWACPPDCAETAVPIGKPIANIQLHILDRSLNPVPVGTPGELHIAGIGLGRGYLNRPGLTAEKFIPDPFGPAGSRLYKTGDLVRYRLDGNIDYLGRIDHQVKIRGFRIELGEIEAQLLKHEGIKEAVVLAREDQPGDKRLVAYLVEEQLATLQIDELKVQLKHNLPDYMLPSTFVVLEQMPLSVNGKLDRKKLPIPEWNGLSVREYEAPQGEVESTLAEVWQELLGIVMVGRNDHFFELGGHSLLVITMIQRLRERGFSAVARTVFATPVLADMAVAIANGSYSSTKFAVPPNLLEMTDETFEDEPLEEFRL
ncbi:non-ribosomal peptide synthetase [Methylomonas methanica]|uniref:Amino acid adenylation domain protein n=1 Tax=Methylomonas methanica (strain DSM 25384 / MC09) TaxID=857087 RepID=G0A7P5_METMM|nr:non-ribosomal peptide synthetase [Methylomonas methanica]AEG01888.1 amino acid adenylation domain protein [Methylomonas methanica MC09]